MATVGNGVPVDGPIVMTTAISQPAPDKGSGNKQLATKIVGAVGATLAFCAVVLFIATLLLRWKRIVSRRKAMKKDDLALSFDKKRQQRCAKMTISNSGKLLNDTLSHTPKKHIHFLISDLKLATNQFDQGNLVGEGGFGKVYRGVLSTTPYSKVAIKVLTGSSSQGVREFITEIEVLSRLDHKNLVRLLGSCMVDEQLLLVYRHVANGSLSDHLHGENKQARTIFSWPMRVKIALGAALGVHHLHMQQPLVLHRDIKAANILLTRGFNAKVCDFGFAKQLSSSPDDPMRFCCTPSRSGAIGTLGYVAPESMMTGELSSAGDVYSFGVVLLELLCGRKPLDFTKLDKDQSLVSWARMLLNQERIEALLDPLIPENLSQIRDSVLLYLRMTRLCLDIESRVRPTMGEIVQTLLMVKAEYESRPEAVVINLSDTDSSGQVSRSNSPRSDTDIVDREHFSKGFMDVDISESDSEDVSKVLRRSGSSGTFTGGSRSWLSLGLNNKPGTPTRG